MTRRIRTAVAGTGFMGRVHLEGLRRFEHVEVAAIAGRNAAAAEKLGSAFGVPHRDLDSILSDSSIQAVHVCTPNAQHFPMAQQTRRLRESGDLGEILVVQGTYSQDWLLYETDWNWRVDSKAGGPSRCMADIGSHWFDMAEHVTGLRLSSLCADLQTVHTTRQEPRGPVETFANTRSGGLES